MVETTTLIVLMAAALVVMALVVAALVVRLFHKNEELKEKNEVIVREIRRNQALIDRAVQHGVSRAALLFVTLLVAVVATTACSSEDDSNVNGGTAAVPKVTPLFNRK